MTLAKYNAMPPLAGNETPLPDDDTEQSTYASGEERKRLARIATEYRSE